MRIPRKPDMEAFRQEIVGIATIVFIGMAALIIAACCSACSGPNRKQYAQLLHDCRAANREHTRMLKNYENMDCKEHPEQSFGSVELGLGGL